MPQTPTPDPWADFLDTATTAAAPSRALREGAGDTTNRLLTWLKEGVAGGAARRLESLADLPKVGKAFLADPAATTLNIAEAPFRTIGQTLAHPIDTLANDPLQILEALSVANMARRGAGKLAATHVKPLTKERLQAKSAAATTSVLSPKQVWKTNNVRMRTQEPGFEHIPANAMPGFRLQQMADRMAPEQPLSRRMLGLGPNPTRPSLTDEFLQKLDDQVINPAEVRASALIANDPRSITASDFLKQASRTQAAKLDDALVSPLVPEPGDAVTAAMENFKARSPHGTVYDATPDMPPVEVLDPLRTPRPTAGGRPALANGRGLPSGSALSRASGGYADDVADAEATFPRTTSRSPDLDATPTTVELPMPASQMDAMKKAVNKYGASKFGKDVTDAQFYARDKIRGDIKEWLEKGSGGTDARSTLELPRSFDDMTLKEANMLEGDALALKRLVTDKFQQLGSAPPDNSYRTARLLSNPLAPLAPQARTALIGIGLDSPAARLAKANMLWNAANKSGASRALPWAGGVVTNRRLAGVAGSMLDQANEQADPWADFLP